MYRTLFHTVYHTVQHFKTVSVCRTAAAVFQDFETKKAAGALTLGAFDQRPYFRILLNLLDGMNKPDRQLDNSNLQASLDASMTHGVVALLGESILVGTPPFCVNIGINGLQLDCRVNICIYI